MKEFTVGNAAAWTQCSVFYLAHWQANELTTEFANFCLANIQGMQKIEVLV